MYTMLTSRWHCCSCVQLNRSRLMTVRPLLNVVGDCIHLSRASLAVRFLGHEKKRLSHFIRSTWNNYCVQCGDVAGNTNSAVLFDIFIAEHLFTSSCVRVFWTCLENGTFGWLVSHTEWRLIEIIWLCLWSRIGGGGQACNFIELHRSALYWALYMLCTIYCASLGFTWLHALQCNVFWSSASMMQHHIAQLLLARMLLNKTNVLQSRRTVLLGDDILLLIHFQTIYFPDTLLRCFCGKNPTALLPARCPCMARISLRRLSSDRIGNCCLWELLIASHLITTLEFLQSLKHHLHPHLDQWLSSSTEASQYNLIKLIQWEDISS